MIIRRKTWSVLLHATKDRLFCFGGGNGFINWNRGRAKRLLSIVWSKERKISNPLVIWTTEDEPKIHFLKPSFSDRLQRSSFNCFSPILGYIVRPMMSRKEICHITWTFRLRENRMLDIAAQGTVSGKFHVRNWSSSGKNETWTLDGLQILRLAEKTNTGIHSLFGD